MNRLRHAVRATLMPGFAGLTAPEWLLAEFSDGLGAACVYGENARDGDQLAALGIALRTAAPRAVLAIDEEGGEVTRLHYRTGAPYPGAAILGRLDDPAYTAEIGRRVARDAREAGFDLVLGPVADVNSDPRNPVIGTRSFGADPERVSRHVAAWVGGLQEAGASACAKHFPGHGATTLDSHLALPVVDADPALVAQRDLPPFAAAIAAGVRAIMTSHILLPAVDPDRPATFSPLILQGILRDRFGFTGAIVSDALDMQGASAGIGIPEAAVRALAAGCDLLCLGTGSTPELLRAIEDHVIDAIRNGRLDEDRIRRSAARARELAAASERAATITARRPPRYRDEAARIARSFAGAEATAAWLAAHPRATVIRVETTVSQAIGTAPWGPFAAAEHPLPGVESAARSFARRPVAIVDAGTRLPWPVPRAVPGDTDPGDTAPGDTDPGNIAPEDTDAGIIVIGRDLHRHAFAREGIDLLRHGREVRVVETGWPGSRRYADLASYGASALAGAALLTLFEEGPS